MANPSVACLSAMVIGILHCGLCKAIENDHFMSFLSALAVLRQPLAPSLPGSAATVNLATLSLRTSPRRACWLNQTNSKITASTARLSPGLALTLLTVASHSARRIFSIFIASTVQSGSPALISCPSAT